jgi:hypothetical protein
MQGEARSQESEGKAKAKTKPLPNHTISKGVSKVMNGLTAVPQGRIQEPDRQNCGGIAAYETADLLQLRQ